MSEQRAIVHFRCSNPKHQQSGGNKSDTLTIHEGKWAYCGAVHAEPHHWVPTGGVPYFELLGPERRRAGA